MKKYKFNIKNQSILHCQGLKIRHYQLEVKETLFYLKFKFFFFFIN